jgi:hypothetical protein
MEHNHEGTVHGRALGNLKGNRHILFVAVVPMTIALVIHWWLPSPCRVQTQVFVALQEQHRKTFQEIIGRSDFP